MTRNRQWLLDHRPDGMVTEDVFRLHEVEVDPPEDGQVLIRNTWFPLEPAMRGWIGPEPSYLPPVEIGAVMRGFTYGEVVESRHADFAVGDRVTSFSGWQEYVTDDGAADKVDPTLAPEMVLSVLGVTGLTAYVGHTEIGQVGEGDTVVVSGAAGATGSVAAQLARTRGCRVVGIAGGPAKCAWLTDVARLDGAIDYHGDDVAARLDELCPDGIDVYYDNVGGPILDLILVRLALHARIVVCGAIVRFGDDGPAPGPENYWYLIQKRARMEGFVIFDYLDRAREVATELGALVEAGELAYEVDVQTGFENLPAALRRLYTGQNLGKQLLRATRPQEQP
jgi:NADPH-dependent curcumin reductase CurA